MTNDDDDGNENECQNVISEATMNIETGFRDNVPLGAGSIVQSEEIGLHHGQ